jgi:outer membrane receptor protein involved in Fe transport
LSANLNFQSSKGDFPFSYNYFGKDSSFRRENADFTNGSFSISGKADVSNWKIWARGIYSKTDKGVPGAVLQGNINQNQTRFNEENFAFLINSNRIFENNSSLMISGLFKKNNTIFTEPSKTAEPENKYFLNDFEFILKYNFSFVNFFHEIIADFSYASLSGNMLDPSVNSFVNRALAALAYRIEKDFETENQNFSLNGGIRFDKSNDNNFSFSATFGGIYSIKKLQFFKLRTNFSHNFRLPNFNEMYYQNYGTKNLKPEKSNNYNLGLIFNLANKFNFNIDGFIIDTKDMIISVPQSPVVWSAKNLDKSTSKGLEFSLNLIEKLNFMNENYGISNINLSYTLQKIVDKTPNSLTFNKKLIYIPEEMFSFLLDFKIKNVNLGLKGEYSSFRYLQSDNAPNAILPSYFTCDLFIYKNIQLKSLNFLLRFDCKNLFNEKYEIISNYIMPSRQFRVSLGFEY